LPPALFPGLEGGVTTLFFLPRRSLPRAGLFSSTDSTPGSKRKVELFPSPRSYTTQMSCMATIGRRHGVAEIFGWQFSGYLAWLLWRTIYLSKLPGVQKKVRVALDWTLDLIFSKDLVQLPTLTVFGDVGDGAFFNCNDA
jgi:hypothetical protein